MEASPNIIFILTDQQRADTVQGWGNQHMVTPHIDSLIEGGYSFKNAFCPGATCTPSRAATFTGMYAHNTGTYSFNEWGHQRTWIHELADNGYWCSSVGKMHFQPRDVAGGYHERIVVENPTSISNWGGKGDDDWGKYLAFHGEERPNYRHRTVPHWIEKFQCVPWHLEEKLHSDVFIGDSAVSAIQAYKEDKPLFLQVGFTGPHEPWDPTQRFLDLYENKTFPEPIDFENDLSESPPQHEFVKRRHAECDHESIIDMDNATLADVKNMQKHYYAKISLVDEQVGRVIEALRVKGLLENSILIFSSDHGEMLGDHGMAYKWLMYDSITRVPLIIKDFRKKQKTNESKDLVSLIDLGPTILEAAGIQIPARLEGHSLLPYLEKGESEAPREYVFCEDRYMIMIRSQNTKLVYYFMRAKGELYDLEGDPEESVNCWDRPEFANLKNKYLQEVLHWLSSSTYRNYGYKCQIEDSNKQYDVCWPINETNQMQDSAQK